MQHTDAGAVGDGVARGAGSTPGAVNTGQTVAAPRVHVARRTR